MKGTGDILGNTKASQAAQHPLVPGCPMELHTEMHCSRLWGCSFQPSSQLREKPNFISWIYEEWKLQRKVNNPCFLWCECFFRTPYCVSPTRGRYNIETPTLILDLLQAERADTRCSNQGYVEIPSPILRLQKIQPSNYISQGRICGVLRVGAVGGGSGKEETA